MSTVTPKPPIPIIGIVLFVVLTLGSARAAVAANCISTATGNWTAIAWTNCAANPGGDPLPTDTVTIANGHTVTLDTSTVIAGLTITGTSANTTLVHSGTNSLTVNGTVTINQPTTNLRSSTWNIAAGSATVSGLITLAGTNTTASRDSDLTLSTGRLYANGGITCAGTTPATKDITISSTGRIDMRGTLTNTGCTFAPGTAGIFGYTGTAAQTVDLTWGAGNYYHLHLSNTSASGVTIPAAITATNVGGNLIVENGLFTNGGFAITGGGGDTFQVNDGATFNMSGTAIFPTGFSTYTFQPTSTVRYRQSNAQTISARTYGHLEVSPSANGITHQFATGTTTVAGNLTVGNGTNTGVIVTAATNNTTLDVNGNVTISANTTLRAHATNPFTVAGNWINNGTFTPNGGTVTFDGTAAEQTISGGATTFSGLTIANTYPGPPAPGGVTANVALTVATLVVNASSTFNAGSSSHSVTGTFTNNGIFNGNTSTVGVAGTLTNNATFNADSASYNLQGNFTNSGTFDRGTSTFTFNGTALQSLTGATTFYDLLFNNAAGFTLNNDVTASNALTLTSGVVATGTNTLVYDSTSSCSITRTGGRVNGNLRKNFAAARLTCDFEVGDASKYTPVTVAFASLDTDGGLTVSTTGTEHPDVTNDLTDIDKSQCANRYWTLKNPGLTFSSTYTATFNFCDSTVTTDCPSTDIDAGATPTEFVIRRRYPEYPTAGSWFNVDLDSALGTSTKGNNITGFGDFAVGMQTIPTLLREKELIYIRELYY